MAIAHDITSALAKPSTLVDGWQQLGDRTEWGPGVQVGPYRLKRPLGKGGMGVVWLAEQLQPLQRDVAIKVMASTRRDPLAEAYFEIERQALAQLSHRAIAQIHDAGRLPDGALFFAMEYVPGVPLDDFQAVHPLALRPLVQLFIQICQGVQHAHQRGLIHRDLKPLNILVQQVDGEALPKIIDFGIALGGSSVGTPLRIDRVVGTPAYMSPEQRRPDGRGIDARSDVYALGVVLAEALCRAGGQSRAKGVDATLVRAAVLHELGVEKAAVAVVNPLIGLLKSCPRELLAITARAMAPEREHRYDSAAAMAEDLSRWLDSRPVQAMRQRWTYTLRCAIRRNRLASAALAAVTLAVVLGAGMALYGMARAQSAQALAEQRRNDAEKLIQFMLGDFADKLRPIGRLELLDSVSQQALDYLSAQDEGGDASTALSRARALRTVGEVQATRQQFALAETALQQAAAAIAHSAQSGASGAEYWFESGTIAYWRGYIAYRQREWATAERYFAQYLHDAEQLQVLATDQEQAQNEIAAALSNLGSLAERRDQLLDARRYFERSVQLWRARGDSAGRAMELANSLSWLAAIQGALGDPVAAQANLREALDLVVGSRSSGPDDSRRLQREINLRYLLALSARQLDAPEESAAQLAAALALASQDLANDPTQPRRGLMSARLAYEYARLPISAALHRQAMAQGDAVLYSAQATALSASEARELRALRVLASRPGAAADLRAALDEVLGVVGLADPTPDVDLGEAERAVALYAALMTAAPGARPLYRERLQLVLERVPQTRRQSLRYLLARRQFLVGEAGAEKELAVLDHSIQERRRGAANPVP